MLTLFSPRPGAARVETPYEDKGVLSLVMRIVAAIGEGGSAISRSVAPKAAKPAGEPEIHYRLP